MTGYYTCPVCKRLFEPDRVTQIYCSRRCASRAAHVRQTAKKKEKKR